MWSIIDSIQKQSEIRAIEIVGKITKKKSEDTKESIENRIKDVEEGMKELVNFVKIHILIMLGNVYDKIGKEEKELRKCLIQSPIHVGAETNALNFDPPKVTSQDKQVTRTMQLERYWFSLLYSGQETDLRSLRIVGPVGERPLHVCALSAHRFEHVDFEGKGNYVSEGIIEGMMEYITGTFQRTGAEEILSGDPNKVSAGWREATVQYGKDYCAAVGSLAVNWGSSELKGHPPPFWRQISKWKQAHLHERGIVSTPQRFAKILVETGIYEGETILFPLIAGKNVDAIRKLICPDAIGRSLIAANYKDVIPELLEDKMPRCTPSPVPHSCSSPSSAPSRHQSESGL